MRSSRSSWSPCFCPGYPVRLPGGKGKRLMKIQRASVDAFECPRLTAFELPTRIVDRAVNGLGWVSFISAISSVALTTIQHLLQPEFAAAWNHPVLRLASLGVVFMASAFLLLLHTGFVSKSRLLDLGIVFQINVAFCAGLFEGDAYRNHDSTVVGISAIAVWMMLCGRLMPNAPLKSAITAGMCVAMWPAGYWADLQIFGYRPMPFSRLLVWIMPLCIIAVWMYILNHRTLT